MMTRKGIKHAGFVEIILIATLVIFIVFGYWLLFTVSLITLIVTFSLDILEKGGKQ